MQWKHDRRNDRDRHSIPALMPRSAGAEARENRRSDPDLVLQLERIEAPQLRRVSRTIPTTQRTAVTERSSSDWGMTMWKYLFRLAMVLLFWSGALSQTSVTRQSTSSNKGGPPAIYIDVECESAKAVRLRLYNKTDWAIAVPTYSFYFNPKNVVAIKLKSGQTAFPLPSDRDISSIYYYVERDADQKVDVPTLSYPDSFNESWMASKSSIRFTVPREHLREGLKIFVSFNYEWELSDQGVIHSDVQHRVFFRGVTLRKLRGAGTCQQ